MNLQKGEIKMIEFEQIRRDIDSLPAEAQSLLVDFIQLLKNHYSQSHGENHTTKHTSLSTKEAEKSLYEKFDELGLIGCCSVEENLSTTYKEVLANLLDKKYDNR